MPQFNPLYYINTLSWSFILLIIIILLNQSIFFPRLLKTQLTRYLLISFNH